MVFGTVSSESIHRVSAIFSIVISVGSFIPYVWGFYKGKVHPHVVGWLIWSLLTAIVFLAQLFNGAGAWTTFVICILCFVAVAMGMVRGDRGWTQFDKICFGLTLCSIPLWLLCGDPLYSVVLLTFIEILGFVAMTPKTWKAPETESLGYFVLSIIKYTAAAMALETWSMETALYPVATAIMAIMFSCMIFMRRVQIQTLNQKIPLE